MSRFFLQQGGLALSRVVELEESNWFNGHIGASLIAGANLIASQKLGGAAALSLQNRLRQQIEKFSSHFAPPDDRSPCTDFAPILEAVEINTLQLSRSGHGVIYGSLFLDAVMNGGASASHQQVLNIAKLIRNCASDKWNRYYGLADYRSFTTGEAGDADVEETCALAVERSTHHVYRDTAQHFFSGEKVHAITHAQAILLLKENGFARLAEQARIQLSRQIALNELRPETGLVEPSPKTLDLTDQAVWEQGFADEHQIKLAYSYLYLSEHLTERLPPLAPLWGAINP